MHTARPHCSTGFRSWSFSRRPVLFPTVVVAVLAAFVLGVAPVAQAQSGDGEGDRASWTVGDAVRQVLATHPSLEAARRDVDAAAARVGQARSGYWPRVSAVASYRRQDPVPEVTVPGSAGGPIGAGGQSIGIQPNNLYDGHLQIRQPIYDFGRTGARVDHAESGRTAAERRVDAERADLVFQTVQAFYTTLLADARLEVQRDQIDQLQRTLSVVRRRSEAGTATEFEVQSTRARLSAARSERSRLQSERRRQVAELRRLLGEPVLRGETTLRDPAALQQLAPGDSAAVDVDSLLALALRRHPAVRVAEARVQAAKRGVRVADQSDAPSLNLDAQGGVKNGYPGDLNEPRLNESIGLSLQVPLFQGFSTRRRIQEAEAETRAAEARLVDVQRQVQTRVAQAASDLQALFDRLATTQLRSEQARTAAALARTRYEAGTITNLDLLQAETERKEARLEETEVRFRIVLGRYALQYAAGTLLPFHPVR